MQALSEFLVPYVTANIFFAAILIMAWFRPLWARFLLALSFLAASLFNSWTAIHSPEVYLQFGRVALLPPFRSFIYGFFSENIPGIVLAIAAGQLLICIGLILDKTWTRLACIGGMLFGLGLSALGVGSAFPATLLMSLSFFMLFRRHPHDFIWKFSQYHTHVKSLVL